MSIEETIRAVRAVNDIDGLVLIANRALRLSRRHIISVDDAREFGQHIFNVVAEELPGGCAARFVILACERRATEIAR